MLIKFTAATLQLSYVAAQAVGGGPQKATQGAQQIQQIFVGVV